MAFEQAIVLAAMVLYTAAGTSYAFKGDAPGAQGMNTIDRASVWPYDPNPFESQDHDNDDSTYDEEIR